MTNGDVPLTQIPTIHRDPPGGYHDFLHFPSSPLDLFVLKRTQNATMSMNSDNEDAQLNYLLHFAERNGIITKLVKVKHADQTLVGKKIQPGYPDVQRELWRILICVPTS